MKMEELESYFETLNFHFRNWNDILENESIDIRSSNGCENTEQNVQLLPRKDVSLYGIIPKMEKRSFSACKECKLVFNPKDVLMHKNCTLKVKSQHVSHFTKKVKAKKKLPVPVPPLFPTGLEGVSPLEGLNTTELLPNSMFSVSANELQPIGADVSLTLAKPCPLVESVEDIPLPSTPSSSVANEELPVADKLTVFNSLDEASSTSSNHINDNSHSSIVEVPKGPCTRSIKYSNHSSTGLEGVSPLEELNRNELLSNCMFSVSANELHPINSHSRKWNDILENESIDIKTSNGCENTEQNVQLLPRKDVSLYGIIPKMEKRSFSACKECKLVFNPKDVLMHKNCTLKVKSQHVSHFKKKVKTEENLPILVSPLFPTGLEDVSPLEELNRNELLSNCMFSVSKNELHPIGADASLMLAYPCSLVENVEDIPLPSMAIEELVADKSAAVNSLDKAPPNHVNSHSGIVEDFKGPCTHSIKYSNHSSIILDGDLLCFDTPRKILPPAECTHRVFFTIPDQFNVKMYKTRPKPRPLYGVRKIGGAIVISKQKLVNQRKDILAAISSKHKSNDILSSYKSVSLLNNSHRLNALKVKNNKLNSKKTSFDKSIGNDMKHIRLSSDVNGFIIHADVPEGNEDQQNSIHDADISIMNFK